ncbi:hypothetical protein BFC22_04080 [Carnobacterium divergens]|nr:hypothetical protein BFC22_04080 [Carnobacterium divergens]
MEKVFTDENLKKYSKDVVEAFSTTGIDNMNFDVFKTKETQVLEEIRTDALGGQYKFIRYKEKLILKGRNSIPRCISIPTLKDKVCLKATLETLKEYFPECKSTLLPQECIKEIKSKIDSKKYDYFIKLDISNFYGDIKHYKLMMMLRDRIKDEIFLDLIEQAIINPIYPDKSKSISGVPQGLAISNILAQIYMTEFDEKFKNNPDVFCIRYVDDILVLCSSANKSEVLEDLNFELKRNHLLSLNRKKFMSSLLINPSTEKSTETSFSFLGYKIQKINGGKTLFTIKDSNKVKIENRLILLINQLKMDNVNRKAIIFELNLIITGSINSKLSGDSDSVKRYGWLFFYSQITDESVFYKLDALVKKRIKESLSPDLAEDILKEIKKFSKAFFEIKYNLKEINYIFKPDEFSLEDKKQFLENIFNVNTDFLSGYQIDREFKNRIFGKIKKNEVSLLQGIS